MVGFQQFAAEILVIAQVIVVIAKTERIHARVRVYEEPPQYTNQHRSFACARLARFHFKKNDFQYHQFHLLQVVDSLAFAGDTALSLQFHFRHLWKCPCGMSQSDLICSPIRLYLYCS